MAYDNVKSAYDISAQEVAPGLDEAMSGLRSGQLPAQDMSRATSVAAQLARRRGIGGPLAARMAMSAANRLQGDFMRDREARIAALLQARDAMVEQARQNRAGLAAQMGQWDQQQANADRAFRQQQAQAEAAKWQALAGGLGSIAGTAIGGLAGSGAFQGFGKPLNWAGADWERGAKLAQLGGLGGGMLGSGLGLLGYNPYGY